MRLCIMLLIPILWGMAWEAIFKNWEDLTIKRDFNLPFVFNQPDAFGTIEEAQKFIDDYLLGIKNEKVKSTIYQKYP